MDLVPAASDVSSADDYVVESAQQNQDTIALGEDFSMILMDSIPSLQGVFDSSVQPTAHEDLGDETSLIINKTLASLRQDSGPSNALEHSRPSGGHKVPMSEHADASQQTGGENTNILYQMTPNKMGVSENTVTSAKMTTPYERRPLEDAADFTKMTTPDQLALLKQAIAGEQTPRSENGTTLGHMAAPSQTSTLGKIASPQEAVTSKYKATATFQADGSASTQPNPITNAEVNDDQDELNSDEPAPIALKQTGQMSSPRWARSPRKTPMATPLRHQLLRHRANQSQTDKSPLKGGDAESGSRHTTPGSRAPSRLGSEASFSYEDSFSEIPQHILDAAVPAYYRNAANDMDELQGDVTVPKEQEKHVGSEREALDGDLSRAGESHDAIRPIKIEPRDENELDEDDARTVSMMNFSPGGRAEQFASADETEEAYDASEFDDNAKGHFEPSGSVIKTEVQESWVIQEGINPHEHQNDSNASQDQMTRPALSSIMKAGRMLQSITTSSQSPEARDKPLGSPFRSTESRESRHSSKDNQGFVQANSKSPAPQAQASSWKLEHPFETGFQTARETNFSHVPGWRAIRAARNRRSRRRQGSAASSMHVTPPSDAEMSWVAEAGPISPRLRGDAPLRPATNFGLAGASAPALYQGTNARGLPWPAQGVQEADTPVFGARDARSVYGPSQLLAPASGKKALNMAQGTYDARSIYGPSRLLAPASGKKASNMAQGTYDAREVDEDETDIWELEAQREEPGVGNRQQPFGRRVNIASKQEAELKNDSRGRDAVAQRTLNSFRAGTATSEEELRKKKQPPQQTEPQPAAGPPKRFDFAAFFSPINIPSHLVKQFLESRRNRTQPQETSSPTLAGQSYVPPVSTLFPQVPPRSPPGPRQESRKSLPSRLQGGTPAVDQDDSSLPQSEKAPVQASSLPQATEDSGPQPRQVSRTLFQSSSQSQASAAVAPPRMRLSHADITRWQEASSQVEASRDSVDNNQVENSHVENIHDNNNGDAAQEGGKGKVQDQGKEDDEDEEYQEPLKPLPPKNLSPSKSNLRSPLKPRTLGRVVDFNGRVLSLADDGKPRLRQPWSKSLSAFSLGYTSTDSDLNTARPGPTADSGLNHSRLDTFSGSTEPKSLLALSLGRTSTDSDLNTARPGPTADSGLIPSRLDTFSGSTLDPARSGLPTGPILKPIRLDMSSRPILEPPNRGPSTSSFLNPARPDPQTGLAFRPAQPDPSVALSNPVRSGPSTGPIKAARPGPSTGLFNACRLDPPADSFARPGPSTGHLLGPGRAATLEAIYMQDNIMRDAVSFKQEEQTEPVLGWPLPPLNLSRTEWSRAHWIALDCTLQRRRRGRFIETYERRSDFLLGRTVHSKGVSVRLERWHVDCVDAFTARVGGWDETSVGKRLAALIMGEEMRRRDENHDRPSPTLRVIFTDD
ncbi:hypothetical protein CDD82_7860 [Ophiocordyceps australis]|uniref:Uncharacterized protein n=1 Tax=Ophiocordyceps australis TaxID=1399860 RepID=A0A2C5YNT6_9HYPO|nr:hypothetical protein CDD82_7860 [Ophiocordyceps australis]